MPEHTRTIRRGLAARPALRLAAILAAGILIAREYALPPVVWYAIFACLTLASFALFHVLRRSSLFASDGLLQGAILMLGACLFATADQSGIRQRLEPPSPDYPVTVHGWVVTPVNPTRTGFSFIAQTDSIVAASWTDAEEREVVVYARASLGVRKPDPGMRVCIDGTLERFPAPRNPGENDYGATLGLQGISGVIRAQEIIGDSLAGIGTFRSLVGMIQNRLYTWIDSLHPGEHASFVKGIILGYRADLPEDLKEAFMITGTVHILAVSGSNVALIGLIVMVCSGFARIGRYGRMILTVGGMVFYMLVTGGGPSITRATIMGVVVVLLGLLPRRGDVMQSLGVSACILLLFDPRNLFDAGFLLSFGSVVWIVSGNGIVTDIIRRMPEEIRDSLVLRSALQLSGVSLLAQFGTIPISALYFGQVSLISVLANLVVVPLSAVVLLLGVTELAFYALIPILSVVYAAANGLIIDVLLGLVRLAASIPFASVHIRLSGLLEAAFLYSLFVAVVWAGRPAVRNKALLVCIVCANIIVWRTAFGPTEKDLQWIAADVGQGDAHILLLPSGGTVLIDAGPYERIAERTLIPLLERLNVRSIDQVIVSHPHRDHIGGLSVLLDRLPVRTLVLTDSVRIRDDLLERLSAAGGSIRRVRAGDMIPVGDRVRLYVLNPEKVMPWRGWNNNSIVVMLRYGATKALLTGDLEQEGEEELVRRYGDFLHAELLKAGHHGSETSTSSTLLDAVRPKNAVISVGWRNSFGHPSPRTESVLHERHIREHKTSDAGASWWRSDGVQWSLVRWSR